MIVTSYVHEIRHCHVPSVIHHRISTEILCYVCRLLYGLLLNWHTLISQQHLKRRKEFIPRYCPIILRINSLYCLNWLLWIENKGYVQWLEEVIEEIGHFCRVQCPRWVRIVSREDLLNVALQDLVFYRSWLHHLNIISECIHLLWSLSYIGWNLMVEIW